MKKILLLGSLVCSFSNMAFGYGDDFVGNSFVNKGKQIAFQNATQNASFVADGMAGSNATGYGMSFGCDQLFKIPGASFLHNVYPEIGACCKGYSSKTSDWKWVHMDGELQDEVKKGSCECLKSGEKWAKDAKGKWGCVKKDDDPVHKQGGGCNDIEKYFPDFFKKAKNNSEYEELLACCQNSAFIVARKSDWTWNNEPINGKCACMNSKQKWEKRDKKWGCWDEKEPHIVVYPDCDGECNVLPHDNILAGECAGKNLYDTCKQKNGHDLHSRCHLVKRSSNSEPVLSCAAEVCKDGWSVWYSRKDKNHDFSLWGGCKEKKKMEEYCMKGCDKCNSDEKCLPWYFDNKDDPKIGRYNLKDDPTRAFKECHCVKVKEDDNNDDDTPEKPTNCYYEFHGEVDCGNGNSVKWNKIYPVEQEILNDVGMTCEQFKQMFHNDQIALFKYLDKDLCEDKGNGGFFGGQSQSTGPSQAEVTNATNSMNAFFNSVNTNRSVWKTVDGKFNTARLASDLTAGVVLGTVGGVVSGVVIKKKQVEKGFDALHCTVGGQVLADWGDEFTVGLRK